MFPSRNLHRAIHRIQIQGSSIKGRSYLAVILKRYLVSCERFEGCKRSQHFLVRDSGCGIDPFVLESGRDGHWGLPGMRERAKSIGARLHVWSSACRNRGSAIYPEQACVPATVFGSPVEMVWKTLFREKTEPGIWKPRMGEMNE